MKYVLISLLVMNIGYFGWRWAVPPEAMTLPTVSTQEGAVGSIVLLQEAGPPDRRDADLTNVVNNPVRLAQGENQACFAIGPFEDVFSGQDALEQLVALDQRLELKAVDVATGERDYRVLIPPASSAEEAFRKLRELQASKIDSYVITQGAQAMGISLGVFSTSDAANVLRSRLQSMGYASEIIEIERLSRNYWLFPQKDSEIQAPKWLANRPELELKQMNCIEP
jgi:hypothetical protein